MQAYSDFEICALFKRAGRSQEQIEILSDLAQISVVDVKRILVKNGLLEPQKRKYQKHMKKKSRLSALDSDPYLKRVEEQGDLREMITQMLQAGHTLSEISKASGVQPRKLSDLIRKWLVKYLQHDAFIVSSDSTTISASADDSQSTVVLEDRVQSCGSYMTVIMDNVGAGSKYELAEKICQHLLLPDATRLRVKIFAEEIPKNT